MSPTVPHKIFISVVTGRVFCSTGVKNAPVYTGHIYGPYIRVLGTHYPYIRAVQTKSIANNAFLYGPYIRAVYTGDRDALPVHTARTYGPYVRAVCTGVKNAPVCTGRKYGPHIRVLGTHYPYRRTVQLKIIAVCTGRIYGLYLRVVRIGL